MADPQRVDRLAGILVGSAVGDALGVPYEMATPPGRDEEPRMLGGGLGGYAPGEWSDDTQMAACIALAAAEHGDLISAGALDAVADRFNDWFESGPADIGVQTADVLRAASYVRFKEGWCSGSRMSEVAAGRAVGRDRSAGNGALMRTAAVAAAHLDDRQLAARAARAVAALTHADPLCEESCVLWGEAIRVAATEDRFDFRAGLDLIGDERRPRWSTWIDEATYDGTGGPGASGAVPGAEFSPNGFTVTALQAAVAAVSGTPVHGDDPSRHFADALRNAVRIGHDTDTVAAIAGGLLGARWGYAAIPALWRDAVHGWPGLTGTDLHGLAVALAHHQARR